MNSSVTPVLLTIALALLVLAVSRRRPPRQRRARQRRLVACPHLGRADDPLSRGERPDEWHRCYYRMQRERVDLAHQLSFCLSPAHLRCPWLVASPAAPSRARLAFHPALAAARRLAAGPRAAALLSVAWLDQLRRGLRPGALAAEAWLAAARRAIAARLAGDAEASIAPALPRALRQAATPVARAILAAAAVAARRLPLLVRATAGALAWLWPRVWAVLRVGGRATSRALAWLARALLRVACWMWVGVRHSARVSASRMASLLQQQNAAWRAVWRVRHEPADKTPVAAPVHAARAGPAPAEPPLTPLRQALARGIAALESGQDDLAYQFFVQACHEDGRDARAWFWRARTAPTLDEVIACLERAASLAPDNDQVRVNLEWARARHERERALAELTQPTSAAQPRRRPAPSRPPARLRYGRAAATLAAAAISLVAATACLLVGALWLVGSLPEAALAGADERLSLFARLTPQLDLSALRGGAEWGLLNDYDPFSALPYAMGFLALLAGGGLLRREGWARWWGPLVALASVALWLSFASVGLPTPLLVGLGSVAAVAGPLTPEAEEAL